MQKNNDSYDLQVILHFALKKYRPVSQPRPSLETFISRTVMYLHFISLQDKTVNHFL